MRNEQGPPKRAGKGAGSSRRPRVQEPFRLGTETVQAGQRRTFELPAARLVTQTYLSLPIAVVHGIKPGARLWLASTVHGDEINGVEIIRRVLEHLDAATLRGTLVAVPIVNVFGFINETRYLPDRRDLNRSFPGSSRGSLASRLAHLFMTEVVGRCTHGIDLHTASDHRTNLPQIRADLTDPETRRCAEAFGAPVMIHARLRDGSLREAATSLGMPVLLYEGGESQRFNDRAIEAGVSGVLRVLRFLGMWRGSTPGRAHHTRVAPSSVWVRARRSGLFRRKVRLGEMVQSGQELGVISDAFGEVNLPVRAPEPGMVIGVTQNPLVNRGDGIVHVAEIADQSSP
jgi:predicted deacylase